MERSVSRSLLTLHIQQPRDRLGAVRKAVVGGDAGQDGPIVGRGGGQGELGSPRVNYLGRMQTWSK